MTSAALTSHPPPPLPSGPKKYARLDHLWRAKGGANLSALVCTSTPPRAPCGWATRGEGGRGDAACEASWDRASAPAEACQWSVWSVSEAMEPRGKHSDAKLRPSKPAGEKNVETKNKCFKMYIGFTTDLQRMEIKQDELSQAKKKHVLKLMDGFGIKK